MKKKTKNNDLNELNFKKAFEEIKKLKKDKKLMLSFIPKYIFIKGK